MTPDELRQHTVLLVQLCDNEYKRGLREGVELAKERAYTLLHLSPHFVTDSEEGTEIHWDDVDDELERRLKR